MRLLHRLGIGIIDLLILTTALIYLYFSASPIADVGIFAVDSLVILLIVIISYLIVVAFVSLCLMYMQSQGTIAGIVKGIVGSIMTVAIFSWVLFPILWIFGYNLGADVEMVLMVATVARMIIKFILMRRWKTDTNE